jgi:hypothetical protein
MKKACLGIVSLSHFILLSCATPAWDKYPTKVPPDYSCSYGNSEAGTYYYVWKCLDGKRIVVKQSGFGFGSVSADKYESSCDRKTEIESKRNLNPEQNECSAKLRWDIKPN